MYSAIPNTRATNKQTHIHTLHSIVIRRITTIKIIQSNTSKQVSSVLPFVLNWIKTNEWKERRKRIWAQCQEVKENVEGNKNGIVLHSKRHWRSTNRIQRVNSILATWIDEGKREKNKFTCIFTIQFDLVAAYIELAHWLLSVAPTNFEKLHLLIRSLTVWERIWSWTPGEVFFFLSVRRFDVLLQ